MKSFDVVVMHDFFVDRLVYTRSLPRLLDSVKVKSGQGGGGIHGVTQEEVRGGNAVNLAHALARLGLRTLLITHSDFAHERMVKSPFEGLNAEVRIKHKPPGLTVALEERVNVMLGHGGGAEDFGPELLNLDDWDALRGSRVVCSVNWAANKKGTVLLETLRGNLGKEKTIFFDPADFRDRMRDFSDLMFLIGNWRLVNWMSLNEEEAVGAARILGVKAKGLEALCLQLAERLQVALEVHTAGESFSVDGGKIESAKTKRVIPLLQTGAGDVWDAASIYGRLNGFGDLKRLRFANAAAGLYLIAKDHLPPKLGDVLREIR